MLMALGMFVFSLPTLAHQELARDTDWRHARSDRFGARAASQFCGPGEDRITLNGLFAPEITGGGDPIGTLRAMGDQGEVWPLVDGTGRVLGQFVIARVSERQSVFLDNGVARRSDFSLDLERID